VRSVSVNSVARRWLIARRASNDQLCSRKPRKHQRIHQTRDAVERLNEILTMATMRINHRCDTANQALLWHERRLYFRACNAYKIIYTDDRLKKQHTQLALWPATTKFAEYPVATIQPTKELTRMIFTNYSIITQTGRQTDLHTAQLISTRNCNALASNACKWEQCNYHTHKYNFTSALKTVFGQYRFSS